MPARAPHGSGRAQLTHPALQVRRVPTRLSICHSREPMPRFVGVALRCGSAASRGHLSPRRESGLSPPSLGRVPWGGFPGVGGSTGRSDSSRSSARPSVSLGRAYLGRMVCSLPERAHLGRLEAWSFGVRGTVPVICGGNERRPTFLGNPDADMPCSRTPAALHARPLAACWCCLPLFRRRRRRQLI